MASVLISASLRVIVPGRHLNTLKHRVIVQKLYGWQPLNYASRCLAVMVRGKRSQDFYQDRAYLECGSRRVPVPYNPSTDIYNDGWQTTLDLISQQAAAMSA